MAPGLEAHISDLGSENGNSRIQRSGEKIMTRFESFRQMQRVIRSASGLLLGAAVLLASFTLGSTPAFAQFGGPEPLSLVNGWINAPFGTSNATVEEVNGV